MEDVGAATLGQMCSHIAERSQQKLVELFVSHAVVLDGFAIRRFIRDIVGWVGHDEVGFHAIHEQRHIISVGAVAADHPMPAQCPHVTRLHEGLHFIRLQLAVIVLDILVMYLAEQIIDLAGIKAGRTEIVTGLLQIREQISQRDRFPFADCFIQSDVQGLFILRVFDVNDHAVDLRCPPSAVSTLYR